MLFVCLVLVVSNRFVLLARLFFLMCVAVVRLLVLFCILFFVRALLVCIFGVVGMSLCFGCLVAP